MSNIVLSALHTHPVFSGDLIMCDTLFLMCFVFTLPRKQHIASFVLLCHWHFSQILRICTATEFCSSDKSLKLGNVVMCVCAHVYCCQSGKMCFMKYYFVKLVQSMILDMHCPLTESYMLLPLVTAQGFLY